MKTQTVTTYVDTLIDYQTRLKACLGHDRDAGESPESKAPTNEL